MLLIDEVTRSVCKHIGKRQVSVRSRMMKQSDDVIKQTGSSYFCYAPVWCCDRFDRGSRRIKRENIDLVTEDYDVSLCQGIAVVRVTLFNGSFRSTTLMMRAHTEEQNRTGQWKSALH